MFTNTLIFTLSPSGPQLIQFNYLGIDNVVFTPVANVEQFTMDNVTVDVPEASVSTLFSLGVGILIADWKLRGGSLFQKSR